MSSEPQIQKLGEEGDACEQCGAVLATDQRYCLNCGTRRGAPRVEPGRQLLADNGQATVEIGAVPQFPAVGEWSPITVIGTIAVLGVMLLLGVLIGNNKNTTTVAGTAAPTTTATATTPTTAATTTPTGTTASKTAKPGKVAGGAVAGGSGSTAGIATANTSQKTGAAYTNATKNGPNVVATPGSAPANDPNRKPGGGSAGACIGC